MATPSAVPRASGDGPAAWWQHRCNPFALALQRLCARLFWPPKQPFLRGPARYPSQSFGLRRQASWLKVWRGGGVPFQRDETSTQAERLATLRVSLTRSLHCLMPRWLLETGGHIIGEDRLDVLNLIFMEVAAAGQLHTITYDLLQYAGPCAAIFQSSHYLQPAVVFQAHR